MSCFKGFCMSSAKNNVLDQPKNTKYENNTSRPNIRRNNKITYIPGTVNINSNNNSNSNKTKKLQLYINKFEIEQKKNYNKANKLTKNIKTRVNKVTEILSRDIKLKKNNKKKKII